MLVKEPSDLIFTSRPKPGPTHLNTMQGYSSGSTLGIVHLANNGYVAPICGATHPQHFHVFTTKNRSILKKWRDQPPYSESVLHSKCLLDSVELRIRQCFYMAKLLSRISSTRGSSGGGLQNTGAKLERWPHGKGTGNLKPKNVVSNCMHSATFDTFFFFPGTEMNAHTREFWRLFAMFAVVFTSFVNKACTAPGQLFLQPSIDCQASACRISQSVPHCHSMKGIPGHRWPVTHQGRKCKENFFFIWWPLSSSSWTHRQSFPSCQWSWCAGPSHEGPRNAGDRGGP